MTDKWEPMNAIQRLIADYLSDHPDENYTSIAKRGGMPRQTVYALAKRSQVRAAPRQATIEALAKGLGMSLDVVKSAAGMTAGYGQGVGSVETEKQRMLVELTSKLDEEKLDALLRRARALTEEMREEAAARKRGRTRS